MTISIPLAGRRSNPVTRRLVKSHGVPVSLCLVPSPRCQARGIDSEPIVANLHLREATLFALLDMLDDDFGGIDGDVARRWCPRCAASADYA